jgi:hypothetical protein
MWSTLPCTRVYIFQGKKKWENSIDNPEVDLIVTMTDLLSSKCKPLFVEREMLKSKKSRKPDDLWRVWAFSLVISIANQMERRVHDRISQIQRTLRPDASSATAVPTKPLFPSAEEIKRMFDEVKDGFQPGFISAPDGAKIAACGRIGDLPEAQRSTCLVCGVYGSRYHGFFFYSHFFRVSRTFYVQKAFIGRDACYSGFSVGSSFATDGRATARPTAVGCRPEIRGTAADSGDFSS